MSETDSRPRRRSRRRVLGAWTLVALATLVALEVGARVLERLPNPHAAGGDPELAEAGLYRPSDDPVLGWELTPGFRATTAHGVEIAINSSGFRGPEPSPGPPPEGTVRVAVLGDSEVFGEKLPLDQTLAGALGAALSARWGIPVEALDLGTNGYDTRQELRIFETRFAAFEPDAVLLYYVTNDALPAALLERGPIERWSALARLVSNLRVLARHRAEMGEVSSYAEWVARAFDPASERWRANRALVLELVRSVEERGAVAVVAPAPELFELTEARELAPGQSPYRAFNAAIAALASEGVRVVDPQAALADTGRPPTDFWVTSEDHHKNALANRLVAEHLAASGAFDAARGPVRRAGGMVSRPPPSSASRDVSGIP